MASSRSGSSSSKPIFQGDSILFHGSKVPREVKKMVQHLGKIKLETFKRFLTVVNYSLENDNIGPKSLTDLKIPNLSDEVLSEVFSGIYTILKATRRHNLASMKQDLLKAELTSYKIPEHLVDEIMKILFEESHVKVDTSVGLKNKVRFPRLESLKWRVDVTISTSSLNRVLVPTILMEVTSSDGSVKSFEVSLSKFNELEYDVAFLLKEMEDLEKRNILKIED